MQDAMPDPYLPPTDAPDLGTMRPAEPALPPVTAVERIQDAMPWAKPIHLDGVLERQRFHPLLAAGAAFFIGFLIYQIVGAIAMVVAASGSVDWSDDPGTVMETVLNDGVAIFGGNAVGQYAGFFVFVWFVAWLHSRDTQEYLRVRRADWGQLALGAVGWMAIVPLVSWLGEVNSVLPMPESLRAWDQQQADMIEQVLGADLNLWYVLLVVAVTPALCEELMFRGYLQRQVERTWGVLASILVVGIFFGAFHLRPTQLLPLSTLGIYLGFSVWVSGSLWVGVLIHLLNNGLAAIVSDYAAQNPDAISLETLESPWYLALLSAVVVAGVVLAQLRRRKALLAAPSPPLSR